MVEPEEEVLRVHVFAHVVRDNIICQHPPSVCVHQSKKRAESLTPEELAVVRDPPAAPLEGPVGREAHHRALDAREHLVEVRDVRVQLVDRLPDLL